jgi:hypothetical protein
MFVLVAGVEVAGHFKPAFYRRRDGASETNRRSENRRKLFFCVLL